MRIYCKSERSSRYPGFVLAALAVLIFISCEEVVTPAEEHSEPVDGIFTPLEFNTGETSRNFTFSGLNNQNIFLLEVNTASSGVVTKADAGSAVTISGSLLDLHNSRSIIGPDSQGDLEALNSGAPYHIHNEAALLFAALPAEVIAQKLQEAALQRSKSIVSRSVVSASYSVNDVKEFTIVGNPSVPKTFKLVSQGVNCNIWIDVNCFDDSSTAANDNKLTTVQAETLADKFDALYEYETNLFGYEYGGGPGGDGGADGDPRVQVLVHDIDGDFTPTQNGGTGGFFYGGDGMPVGSGYTDNSAEIMHSDAHFIDYVPSFGYSVLAHEFQHMINFNMKNLEHSKTTSTWFNEMLSMLAEDTAGPAVLGIGINDPSHPANNRIITFLQIDGSLPITTWHPNTLYSYATTYAFGAFLVRNYGGAELVYDLMHSDKVDVEAIDAALAMHGRNSSFIDALTHFGEARIFTASSGIPAGVKSYGNTVTKIINGISYTYEAFDPYKPWVDYGGGRTVQDSITPPYLSLDESPNSHNFHCALIYQDTAWKNKTGDLKIRVNKPTSHDIKLYLVKR